MYGNVSGRFPEPAAGPKMLTHAQLDPLAGEFWTGTVLAAPGLAPGCLLLSKLPFAAILGASSFDARPRRPNQAARSRTRFCNPVQPSASTSRHIDMSVSLPSSLAPLPSLPSSLLPSPPSLSLDKPMNG